MLRGQNEMLSELFDKELQLKYTQHFHYSNFIRFAPLSIYPAKS